MKCLILAAGYAIRLYPLTLNKPKHLLEVGGKPVLSYILEKIENVEEIDKVYVVTNAKFYSDFLRWKEGFDFKKEIKILNDGTLTKETKLGAIGDINFVIKKEKIKEDLLIIAGDNLFDFDLKKLTSYYKEKNNTVIASFDIKDFELAKLHSIVELDKNNQVIYFEEKPKEPKTTLISVCMYLLPKIKIGLVESYLKEGNNPDCPGFFIQWLYKRDKVYAFKFAERWYDIGNIEQLKEADKYFSKLFSP